MWNKRALVPYTAVRHSQSSFFCPFDSTNLGGGIMLRLVSLISSSTTIRTLPRRSSTKEPEEESSQAHYLLLSFEWTNQGKEVEPGDGYYTMMLDALLILLTVMWRRRCTCISHVNKMWKCEGSKKIGSGFQKMVALDHFFTIMFTLSIQKNENREIRSGSYLYPWHDTTIRLFANTLFEAFRLDDAENDDNKTSQFEEECVPKGLCTVYGGTNCCHERSRRSRSMTFSLSAMLDSEKGSSQHSEKHEMCALW